MIGPDFGSVPDTSEPIFSRISRYSHDPTKPGKTSVMCDSGNPRGGLGAKATTFVKCSSDEEVLKGIQENVGGHDFSFGRFGELAAVQGCESFYGIPLSVVLMEHRVY
jgi:RNA exonuclease 1